MATLDERIKALEEKLKQEKAKKQRVEALRLRAQKQLQRSQDTRKKILLGAYLFSKMENEETRLKIMNGLNGFLVRSDDRALFDLPPFTSEQPAVKNDYLKP